MNAKPFYSAIYMERSHPVADFKIKRTAESVLTQLDLYRKQTDV